MRIIITGHTSGLGKELFTRFNEPIGLSRSNGYDINSLPVMDADILINNAYQDFDQVKVLYDYYNQWKDFNRLIINISSQASNEPPRCIYPYAAHKMALDTASEQLFRLNNKCKTVTIRPGLIDTPMVGHCKGTKMSVANVSDMICEIINLWRNKKMLISNITMFPVD